jgi:hypothetical protein
MKAQRLRRMCLITATGVLLAVACGQPQYNYSFAGKGGAQRFPKLAPTAPDPPSTPDAGADAPVDGVRR